MITKFKIFEEQEVSSGNATGQGGGASLPFGRGYYHVGNNGEFGIGFTPSSEKRIKSYKKSLHSKKEFLEKKKKKELLKKAKENENEKNKKI